MCSREKIPLIWRPPTWNTTPPTHSRQHPRWAEASCELPSQGRMMGRPETLQLQTSGMEWSMVW